MRIRLFAAVFAACCFAAMQARADTAPAASPTAIKSELAYTSYYVLDQKRALDFYVGLLGMAPEAALLAGTREAAKLLGVDAEAGTLEAGKMADVVAVSGNVLKNIAATEQPVFVMKHGAVIVKK